MMKLAVTILIVALSGGLTVASQSPSKTYQDTHKLLSRMDDYDLYPERLAALFRIGDARIGDLAQALDDPDKEISLNAQRVIRYLGNEAGLQGLAGYYRKPRKEYWSSGPIPIPLIDWDYNFIKSNLSSLKEGHIYALALDDSAGAKELLASILAANANPQMETFMGRALISVKSSNPNKLLTGSNDLAKLVLKNAFFVGEFDKKYASARLIGFNGAKDKAIIEIYINRGPLSMEKYHVVIRKHENGWKFFSITRVSIS
jgi:hypothetical protein